MVSPFYYIQFGSGSDANFPGSGELRIMRSVQLAARVMSGNVETTRIEIISHSLSVRLGLHCDFPEVCP